MSSRKASGIPFMPDDLRYIADQVEKAYEGLGGADIEDGDDFRYNVAFKVFDDSGWFVGEVRAHQDGWLGFYPEGWE